MARLTLLIGPAGCGKTHRVLTEAAQCALTGPLPTAATPPLLVIVPEQQAAGTERALLERIAAISGQPCPAASRLRVMSLSRLARVLGAQAGHELPPLGDLGRRMLIWRMLEGGSEPARRARAEALSDAVAELMLYGTAPEDLEHRAAELETGATAEAGLADATTLGDKLRELARITRGISAECSARGLDFTPAAARLPKLLSESNWPHLGVTRVWVDGFAGFTPAEESALLALLRNTAAVTATVLIDPLRTTGPLETDTVDWYAPTRATLARWRALAKDAPATCETVKLNTPALPRWPAGSPLAGLARPNDIRETKEPVTDQARVVVANNERGEVDHCARTILDLVDERGYRFCEISVATRSLEPYADLVATRFREHGIPCYLDRREPVAQHPLVEQLRCGLRLALGQATDDDVYTLLKAGLLRGDGDPPWTAGECRDRADRLENYARAHGLRPGHWLWERPWEWRERLQRRDGDDPRRALRRDEQAAAATAELDSWRRELLAPVMALRQAVREDNQPTVGTALAAAWGQLAGEKAQAVLEDWAAAAETADPPRPAEAGLHRGITGLAAKFLDEINSLAGDIPLGRGGISAAELCTWFEYGLSALSLGQPPLNLDSVLVTEVERGRHHLVKATLLLGLAEDSWPPPAQETALFSDAERSAINAAATGTDPGRGLTGPGSVERGEREPYLALVALTRSAEYIQLMRPAADDKGGARPASAFYKHCCRLLGIEELQANSDGPLSAATPLDLACWEGINRSGGAARNLLAGHSRAKPALAALDWGTAYGGSKTGMDPLAAETMATLAAAGDGGRLILRGSTSRLEAFAACPFKHYARYFLGLHERPEALFDQRTLGSLYHEVLQHTVDALNHEGYSWPGDPREVYARSLTVLEETIATLAAETGRQRSAHLHDRARLILWHQAHELCASLAGYGRSPRATELRIGGRGDRDLPPLILEDAHLRLELTGFIDRLDSGTGGITVVDYKFKGGEVRWGQFLAGTQIQLFAYLLAAGEARLGDGHGHGGLEAVEYQPIEVSWKDGKAQLSAKREPPPVKKDKDAGKYDGLLARGIEEVRRIMLELSSRLLAGEIAPLPLCWKNGKQTACGFCDFREACRFDPLGGERYREVNNTRNDKLRQQVLAGEDFTGSALAGTAPGVER